MNSKKTLIVSAISLAISGNIYADGSQPSFQSNAELMDIQNSCIIRFDNATASGNVTGLARAFAAQANANVKHVYKHSIKGFAINMPCHAAEKAFGDNADISSLTPDSIISINKGKPGSGGKGQESSYGTTRVGGPVDGTGYTAWIIDSGVDLDHPDLNVDTSRGFSSISRGGMDDQNGHGTHVAGTIGAIDNSIGALGVAPNTTIVPYVY